MSCRIETSLLLWSFTGTLVGSGPTGTLENRRRGTHAVRWGRNRFFAVVPTTEQLVMWSAVMMQADDVVSERRSGSSVRFCWASSWCHAVSDACRS